MKSKILQVLLVYALICVAWLFSESSLQAGEDAPLSPVSAQAQPESVAKTVAVKDLPGAVQLTAIAVPPELLAAGIGAVGGQIFPPASQFEGKMPLPEEQLIERLTGVFMADPQIVFVLFKSAPLVLEHDRMIIDTNGNGLLDDEKVIELPAGFSGSAGKKIKLMVMGVPSDYVFRREGNQTQLVMPSIFGGEVAFEGAGTKLAAFSANNDFTNRSTIIFLDKNHNGKFDITGDPFTREYFFLSRQLSVGSDFYDFKISPDGTSVLFKKYQGPDGTLSVKLPEGGAAKASYYFFELLPENGSSPDIKFVYTKNLPLKIPDGTYSLIGAGVMAGEIGKLSELVTYANDDFTIKGGNKIFDVSKVSLKILVGQSSDGNVLKIGQKTSGEGSTVIHHVGDLDPNLGPAVIISNAQKPAEVIVKSNLEYG